MVAREEEVKGLDVVEEVVVVVDVEVVEVEVEG